MTHEDQVDMIIEELSDVEWGLALTRTLPTIYHVVKIESNLPQPRFSESLCTEYNTQVYNEYVITKSQFDTIHGIVQLNMFCPKCLDMIKSKPYRYGGFKVYEITKGHIYFNKDYCTNAKVSSNEQK